MIKTAYKMPFLQFRANFCAALTMCVVALYLAENFANCKDQQIFEILTWFIILKANIFSIAFFVPI